MDFFMSQGGSLVKCRKVRGHLFLPVIDSKCADCGRLFKARFLEVSKKANGIPQPQYEERCKDCREKIKETPPTIVKQEPSYGRLSYSRPTPVVQIPLAQIQAAPEKIKT